MVHADTDQDPELKELQDTWQQWNIRKSPAGKWRATRRGRPLTYKQLSEGMAETLHADDAADLRTQLTGQDALESADSGSA